MSICWSLPFLIRVKISCMQIIKIKAALEFAAINGRVWFYQASKTKANCDISN